MSATLEVLLYLFVTHLAALRWTISSECFCLETVAAYSMCGRTSVLYIFSLSLSLTGSLRSSDKC